MPRATGIFLVLDICDIEEIVQTAVARMKKGLVVMEYTDSGTNVVKGWPMDIQTTLLEARYALQVKNPDKYGPIDRVRVANYSTNFRSL